MNTLEPLCIGCDKVPEEIKEYVLMGREYGITPSEFVLREEGTLNRENGHFLCTDCYIKAGQPSSPRGWIAP